MSTKEDLKNYLRKAPHVRRIALAILVMLLGLGILLFGAGYFLETLPPALVCFLLAILLNLSANKATERDRKKFDNLIDEMERDGRLTPILQDFDNAQHFFGKSGELRLGETYIFVHNRNNVLTYQDIERVYYFGYEDSDYFAIETKDDGWSIKIEYCKYEKKDIEDIREAMSVMTQRNPSIDIDRRHFPESVRQ